MANEQNLNPVKTKSEARERGRNGGLASGKAKKAKKIAAQTYAAAMRELMKRSYRTDLSTDAVKKTCEAFGVSPTQSGAVFAKRPATNVAGLSIIPQACE